MSPQYNPIRLLAAATLAMAPLPAMARQSDEVSQKLADPATQLAVTTVLTAVSEAMLDLRLEPVVRAMRAAGQGDAVSDLPPDARLRDLAGPTGARLPADLGHQVPRTMDRAATMAGAVEDMLPQLRQMGAQIAGALPHD